MFPIVPRQKFWLTIGLAGILGGFLLVAMFDTGGSRANNLPETSALATPGSSPIASPEASPAASPTAAVTVEIAMMAFQTPSIKIAIGTTVTWVNNDVVAHTVTNKPDAGNPIFDSGYLQPGESWSYTFEKPGTFNYYCIPHPFMTGDVVVAER